MSATDNAAPSGTCDISFMLVLRCCPGTTGSGGPCPSWACRDCAGIAARQSVASTTPDKGRHTWFMCSPVLAGCVHGGKAPNTRLRGAIGKGAVSGDGGGDGGGPHYQPSKLAASHMGAPLL